MAINRDKMGLRSKRVRKNGEEDGDADVSSNEDSDDATSVTNSADMPGRKFIIDIDALDKNLKKQNEVAITPSDPDPVKNTPRAPTSPDIRPRSADRPQNSARLSCADITLHGSSKRSDRTSSSQSMTNFFENDEVFLVEPQTPRQSLYPDLTAPTSPSSRRQSACGIDNRGYSPCDSNELPTVGITTSVLHEGVHTPPRAGSQHSDHTASSVCRTPPSASMAILMCDYHHRPGNGPQPIDQRPGEFNPLTGVPLHNNNNGNICGQPQCDFTIGLDCNGNAAVPNDLAPPVMVHDLATRTESVVEVPQEREPITFKKIVRQLSQSRGYNQDQYVALRGLRKPSDYFDLALFSCICCISPFGLAALVMSGRCATFAINHG